MSGMALSGQITITTAGTAVQGTDNGEGVFLIKAHPDNTGSGWVGNDAAGDVKNTNGFPLAATDGGVVYEGNMEHLWFNADVNGEKLCWFKVG